MMALFTLLGGKGLIQLESTHSQDSKQQNIDAIKETPGLVAFWDFKKKNASGNNFTAYSSLQADVDNPELYPVYLKKHNNLSKNYTLNNWDNETPIEGDHTGPFGKSIKINAGRLFAQVPRSEFQNKALGMIHGKNPFTLISWVKFFDSSSSNYHSIMGIWDEGNEEGIANVEKKYSGQRQFSLFTKQMKGAKRLFSHFSATGSGSYPQTSNPYAQLRAVDGADITSDEPWYQLAMVYDGIKVTSYVNGIATGYVYGNEHADKAGGIIYDDKFNGSVNPAYFVPADEYKGLSDFEIYSPNKFMIKFDNNRRDKGIYEQYVVLSFDTQNGKKLNKIKYGFVGEAQEDNEGENIEDYTVAYKLFQINQNASIVPFEEFNVIDGVGQVTTNMPTVDVSNGDYVIELKLSNQNGVLSTVRRKIGVGAPLTFGQVVHSGIDKGSMVNIDGAAVFNRALSMEEIQNLFLIDDRYEVEDSSTGDDTDTGDSTVGCTEVQIEIQFDSYPKDTSWEIRNSVGEIVAERNSSFYDSSENNNNLVIVTTGCLPNGTYTFTINDNFNDGLCCKYGNGFYMVKLDNEIVVEGGDFGSTESTEFTIGASDKTGENEFSKEVKTIEGAIVVSPNPLNRGEYLTMDISRRYEHATYRIVDLMGNLKGHGIINENKVIQLSETLGSGVYILTLNIDGDNVKKQIVIK